MIKRILLLLLLSASLSEAAIVRVQSKAANTAATNAATLAITLDATPTAGNYIVVGVANTSASSFVRGAEQAGITWLDYNATSSSQGGCTILFGRVSAAIASATITLTIGSSQAVSAVAVEYSAVNLKPDKMVSASATSTSPASGATATTSSDNELWIGVIAAQSTNSNTLSSPTNSFSIVAQTNTTNGTTNLDRNCAVLERIVSATGTANAGGTLAASKAWVALTMTFDESPVAAGRIPSIN